MTPEDNTLLQALIQFACTVLIYWDFWHSLHKPLISDKKKKKEDYVHFTIIQQYHLRLWGDAAGLRWLLDAFKPLAVSNGTQTVLFCFSDFFYFLEHSRQSNETKDWKCEQLLCLVNVTTNLRLSVTLKPQRLSSPVYQSCATRSIFCPSNI